MTIYLIGSMLAFVLNCFCFRWHHEYCWDGYSFSGFCHFGSTKKHVIAMLIGAIVAALFSWYAVLVICIIWITHWFAWRNIL